MTSYRGSKTFTSVVSSCVGVSYLFCESRGLRSPQPTVMGPRRGGKVPPRGYDFGPFACFLDLPLTTQIRPVPLRPGLDPSQEAEHSLINAVGSGHDPHRGDDGAPAQVVALELKAGLPGPLRGRGHVSAHDARGVAHPQTAGCGGRTGLGVRPTDPPPLPSAPSQSSQPRRVLGGEAHGEGWGQAPRDVGRVGCHGDAVGRVHQSKEPDAGGTPPPGTHSRSMGSPPSPSSLTQVPTHLPDSSRPNPCSQMLPLCPHQQGQPPGGGSEGGRRRRKSGHWSHYSDRTSCPWSCCC